MNAPEQLLEYLGTHNVMTLATVGADGPWAAAVFYVNEGTALYFLSAPTTRHCQNMQCNPRIAATVQEDYSQWEQIKGVQIEGTVQRLNANDQHHAADLYAQKFAFMDPLRIPTAFAAAMQKIAWYRLTPASLYFIDNSLGLGHRVRVEVDKLHGRGAESRQ